MSTRPPQASQASDAASDAPPRGLDRGGHLSELAFDRLRSDRPGSHDAFRAGALAHLAECARCQAAQAALAAADAEVGLRPPAAPMRSTPTATPTPIAQARAARVRRALTLGAPLAAAALALVIALPSGQAPVGPGPGVPPDADLDAGDHIILKSGALDFEVYIHDGTASRLVQSGAEVHPGDRASFRVNLRAPGYLLVVGSDEAGHTYLCWPQDGVVAADSAEAVAIGPTAAPEQLEAAMRFDDVLGDEHLVAVFCPGRFAYPDVATRELVGRDEALLARFRQTHADCTIRAVVLHKVSGAKP
ncbi:MAG: hypothetical protein U1F43_02370 [Myxococcota bacterium]